MLQLLPSTGKDFRYCVSGTLSADDLRSFYAAVDERFAAFGKLSVEVSVVDFKGYASLSALWTFIQHEPGLITKLERYHAVSNQRWFRSVIILLSYIVPKVTFSASAPAQ